MSIFECKGVKSSLLLLLIVGCLFSSGCTALAGSATTKNGTQGEGKSS